MGTLLADAADPAALCIMEPGTRSIQFSSYDREGGNDDGFTGRWSGVGESDGRVVLAEVDGPGYIDRIWTTHTGFNPSDGVSRNPSAKLAVHLDGRPVPAVWMEPDRLFAGLSEPFIPPFTGCRAGGCFSYIPIPFQTHCSVTVDPGSVFFYQLGFTLLPSGTRVEPFSMKLDPATLKRLHQTGRAWDHADRYSPETTVPIYRNTDRGDLVTGEPLTVEFPKGPCVIRVISIRIQPVREAANTQVSITWDDMPEPAVAAPLPVFFATGSRMDPLSSICMEFDGEWFTCRLPMPYRHRAEFTLTRVPGDSFGESGGTPTAEWRSTVARELPEDSWGYLHTRHTPLHHAPGGEPVVLADVTGSGQMVGCAVSGSGTGIWQMGYLEGDDRIEVDGRLIIQGTGTEDFFNCGYYGMPGRLDGPACEPTHGFHRFAPPNISAYRWFILDKIYFNDSFRFTLEHGPDNTVPADYETILYFYSPGDLT